MNAAAALLARSRSIADEVLFPDAAAVDEADRIPPEHLDLFAADGLYGLSDPSGPVDFATATRIVATLASGCLATTFVWLQHHGAVRAVAAGTRPGIRERWFEDLRDGRVRAGPVLAGVRPGPVQLRAVPAGGGYLLTGTATWVTGWDMVDVLHVAARDVTAGDNGDNVVWALIDAVPGPTLSVRPLDMVAVNASRTVHLEFAGHPVPEGRVTGTLPYPDWAGRDAAGLRMNGSLALGLIDRCARLLDAAGLPEAARVAAAGDRCRERLDSADPGAMPEARACAAETAIRAASTLCAGTGSSVVLRSNHAERLLREALFLLVFGSRPAIRSALLSRLAPGEPAS